MSTTMTSRKGASSSSSLAADMKDIIPVVFEPSSSSSSPSSSSSTLEKTQTSTSPLLPHRDPASASILVTGAVALSAAAGIYLAASCPASFAASESLSSLVGGGGGDEAENLALLEKLRTTLDALETAPRLETVPLWLAILTFSEMVPLLPTQPLALTSGILFGSVEGALIIWGGNVAAATISYLLAGGVGRKLAEKIIEEETGGSIDPDVGLSFDEDEDGAAAGDSRDSGGGGGGGNSFGAQWNGLQKKLAASDPVKQAGIIGLYRVAPHPFSASNYLFGLTKIKLTPYVVGTAAGMLPWAAVYAVCGAYGRKLLDGGEAIEQVFDDLEGLIAGG